MTGDGVKALLDEHRQFVAVVLSFAAALAITAGILRLVGPRQLLHTFSRVDPWLTAFALAVAASWVIAWALAFRGVLSTLDTDLSRLDAVLVFLGTMFVNNVTPFGQAGGEPPAAWIIEHASAAEYSTGLTTVATFDAVNVFTGVSLSVIGFVFLVLEVSVPKRLVTVVIFADALAVTAVPVGVYALWRYRDALEARFVSAIDGPLEYVDALVPVVSLPSVAKVEGAIDSALADVERVATDRSTVAFTVGFTALGWVLQSLVLWLVVLAVGGTLTLLPMFFVVPLSNAGDLLPLPGGLGSTEAVLVGLLELTGAAPPLAAAAALLFRGITYLLPTVIGGVYGVNLGVHESLSR